MHYGDVSDQKLARTTRPETHRGLEDLETRQMTWNNVYKLVKRAIKTQESSITLPASLKEIKVEKRDVKQRWKENY